MIHGFSFEGGTSPGDFTLLKPHGGFFNANTSDFDINLGSNSYYFQGTLSEIQEFLRTNEGLSFRAINEEGELMSIPMHLAIYPTTEASKTIVGQVFDLARNFVSRVLVECALVTAEAVEAETEFCNTYVDFRECLGLDKKVIVELNPYLDPRKCNVLCFSTSTLSAETIADALSNAKGIASAHGKKFQGTERNVYSCEARTSFFDRQATLSESQLDGFKASQINLEDVPNEKHQDWLTKLVFGSTSARKGKVAKSRAI